MKGLAGGLDDGESDAGSVKTVQYLAERSYL